jgi:murein DD-endopeptidase MepM/ murein hydrolase activator NlpD
MCYSKKVEMRAKLKNVVLGTACVLCTAALVTATTLLVVNHNANSTGKGGLETSVRPDLLISGDAALSVESSFVPFEEGEIITDDAEDHVLSYFSYRIKPGDMVSVLAQQFDLTQDTLISVNNIKSSRLIHPGEYLRIPSMPGILYTVKKDGETPTSVAEKFKVDAAKCALANNILQDEAIASGRTIFVPDAKLDWATVQEINGDLFHNPLHSWYYISSRYGWRTSPFDASRRTFHGGLDMACSQGTPIYAALSGSVIEVGYNNTYGNYVIIKHGKTGYKTLYGHMSSVDVKQGISVTTSTRIGRVGSTGMSTGPHLHFTVYKNGRSINPMGVLN